MRDDKAVIGSWVDGFKSLCSSKMLWNLLLRWYRPEKPGASLYLWPLRIHQCSDSSVMPDADNHILPGGRTKHQQKTAFKDSWKHVLVVSRVAWWQCSHGKIRRQENVTAMSWTSARGTSRNPTTWKHQRSHECLMKLGRMNQRYMTYHCVERLIARSIVVFEHRASQATHVQAMTDRRLG